jgi:hypothetical protein
MPDLANDRVGRNTPSEPHKTSANTDAKRVRHDPNHRWYPGRWIAAALLIAGIARGIRHLPATRHAAVNADISAQPPAVPVIAGVVVRKDVPIYLDGIGTVP